MYTYVCVYMPIDFRLRCLTGHSFLLRRKPSNALNFLLAMSGTGIWLVRNFLFHFFFILPLFELLVFRGRTCQSWIACDYMWNLSNSLKKF